MIPPEPNQRNRRIHPDLAIALVCISILILGWIGKPSTETIRFAGVSIPTLCGFKLLTTWDCPGCGLTRSLVFALHGEFYKSYSLHIWGIPLAMILLFQIPFRAYRYFTPNSSAPGPPRAITKWVNSAIFLSILLPWAVKTIALAIVRYL